MKSADSAILHVLGNGIVKPADGAVVAAAAQVESGSPGYYLALWKPHRRTDDVPVAPAVFGPLPTRNIAERLKTSASYLGLIDDGKPPPPRTARRTQAARGIHRDKGEDARPQRRESDRARH